MQGHVDGINEFPDDILVEIVSRMNRREAVRTSILSRKWRKIPSLISPSAPVNLVLDGRDLLPSNYTRKKFIKWVDGVLELHHLNLDALIIRSPRLHDRYGLKPGDADGWVFLAMLNRVKRFELECKIGKEYYDDNYEFPGVKMMKPHLHKCGSFAFVSLSFVGVNIGDKAILFLLANCPHLEKLCIRDSDRIQHLKLVDRLPINFKVFEISNCEGTESLEISVPSLVSCTYGGDKVHFPFKTNPNLRELTLVGNVARSFIYEPRKHASYSDQLVKLGFNILNYVGSLSLSSRRVNYNSFDKKSESTDSYLKIQRPDLPRLCSLKHLELNLVLPVGKSIHFFVKFINGSPLLKELSIKISYMVTNPRSEEKLGFPEEAPSPNLDRGRHKNLKVVKMSGYVGCLVDDKFILRLLTIAQSLKTVAIDTESEYYDQKPWDCATQCPKERKGPCAFCTARDVGARTRAEATRRANQLKLSFPSKTKAVLVVT